MRVLIFVMLPTLFSVPATTLAAPFDLSAWLTRQAGHKEVKRRRAAVELLGDLPDRSGVSNEVIHSKDPCRNKLFN